MLALGGLGAYIAQAMLARLKETFRDLERALRRPVIAHGLTPSTKRKARTHFYLFDHAFLRIFWSNTGQVAPGVFRSNQPDRRRLRRLAREGVKTVISLRGATKTPALALEETYCDRFGLTLEVAELRARHAPKREGLIHLINIFHRAEKPLVMHCKSGSDRAGLAAAIYLMVIEGRPLDEARKQLSLRYLHSSLTATGVLDRFLDLYQSRLAKGSISFEEWVRTEYDGQVPPKGHAADTTPT